MKVEVTLVCAICVALDRSAGDDGEAAAAVWDRMKADPVLLDAFMEQIQDRLREAVITRELAQQAMADVGPGGSVAHVDQALRQLLDPRENPDAAARALEEQARIVDGAFGEIFTAVAAAWRIQARGGDAQ